MLQQVEEGRSAVTASESGASSEARQGSETRSCTAATPQPTLTSETAVAPRSSNEVTVETTEASEAAQTPTPTLHFPSTN